MNNLYICNKSAIIYSASPGFRIPERLLIEAEPLMTRGDRIGSGAFARVQTTIWLGCTYPQEESKEYQMDNHSSAAGEIVLLSWINWW
jgi:hypothetical protein